MAGTQAEDEVTAQVGGLEIAEVLPFDRLKADEVSVLFSHIPAEDRLAATLTCKSLNKARAGKPMKTSTLAMLRSEPLQAWAATLGCPLYPYWAELYGLQGVAMYNGRVGRVLGPPNEKGRYPFELDAGMGELPRRKDGVRSKTLKYITVKPSNVHPLTSLDDELVRAVHNAGGQSLLNLSAVVLPRRHSCFLREMQASDMLERPRGGRPGLDIETWNHHVVAMSKKWPDDMDQTSGSLFNSFTSEGGKVPHPLSTKARCQTAWRHHAPFDNVRPLDSEQEDGCVAKWANVVRSPLLAKCGVRLAIQRVEKPNSRDHGRGPAHAMQNTLSTMLMLDLRSGLAPMEWQSGIGDVYLYRGPHLEQDTGDLQHLDETEVAWMWDYTQGPLASGEYIDGANEDQYMHGLARYRAREEEYERAQAELASKSTTTSPHKREAGPDGRPSVKPGQPGYTHSFQGVSGFSVHE